MKINGINLPNNPMQAYILGQRHGTQKTMGSVAMVLTDKFGFHVKENTADEHDLKSVEYLYNCIVELTTEVNEGRITHRDIKQVLAEEHNTVFED